MFFTSPFHPSSFFSLVLLKSHNALSHLAKKKTSLKTMGNQKGKKRKKKKKRKNNQEMERADVIMLCLAAAVLILLYFFFYNSSPPSQQSSQKASVSGGTIGSTSGSTIGRPGPPTTQGTTLQQPLIQHTSKPSAPSSSLTPSRNNPLLISGLKPQQPQPQHQQLQPPSRKPSNCVPCGGLNVGSPPNVPSKILPSSSGTVEATPHHAPPKQTTQQHVSQTHIPDVAVSPLQQTQETEIIENNPEARETLMVTLSPSQHLFQEVLLDGPNSVSREPVMMPQLLPLANSNSRSKVNMGSCDARSCMSFKTEPDMMVLGGSMAFGSEQTWATQQSPTLAATLVQQQEGANDPKSIAGSSTGSPPFTLTRSQPFFTVRYYFSPSCGFCVQFATEWEKLQLSFENNRCVQFETINGSPTNPVGKQQADDALINGERGVKYFPMVTVARGTDKDEYVLRTANEKADELIPRIQQLCQESRVSQH